MPATRKRNDTWPPQRMKVEDSNGPVDLTTADSVKFIAKQGATTITGPVTPIWPADGDGFNAQYAFAAGDLVTASPDGSPYKVEVEVTWDAGTTPPQVETFPNKGTETLIVEIDQG